MKKSALLAVSALSLGVVGLATFTPVVNAVDPATSDATISVQVVGTAGIGGGDTGAESLNVTLDSINAGEMGEKASVAIRTVNNTSGTGTLTLADKDADTSLTGVTTPTNKILAGTDVRAGNSAWGVKGEDLGSSYVAMPASTGEALNVGDDTDKVDGEEEFNLTYGVSTSDTQAADTYTDTVTYTFTVS